MDHEKRRIQCRWCDWSTPAFYVRKSDGVVRSGMMRLHHHIEDNHEDEQREFRAAILATSKPEPHP